MERKHFFCSKIGTSFSADSLSRSFSQQAFLPSDTATSSIKRAKSASSYPTFDAYVAACEQYYTENTTVQLRLYDLAAGSYEVLADSRSDSFSYSPDPHLCAGDQLVYLLGEELWIYDLTAHTAALCMTQANIKNYFVMDHKIFTNTSKDGLSYQFFYTDLDRGTPVEQANGDYAAYRLFAVSCETASKFIGLDKDGTWCQIDKTDYYAEAFDKAQPLRP